MAGYQGEQQTKQMEPVEYFKELKNSLKSHNNQELNRQVDLIKEHITTANQVGQKNLLHKLAFVHETLKKELILYANNHYSYVNKTDLLKFIQKVTPKNSIKIIELERFPRVIPVPNLEKIKEAQNLNVFDGMLVVFTDLTENTYETPAEKKFLAKNRDPVVFGYFHHKKTNIKHDRLYFITDWTDEYCELDFATMLEKMARVGIANARKSLSKDGKYHLNSIIAEIDEKQVNEIVERSLDEMNSVKDNDNGEVVWAPKKTVWTDIKKKLKYYLTIG